MVVSIIFIVVAYALGVFTHYIHTHFSYFKDAIYVVNKRSQEGKTMALTIFYDEEYYDLERKALIAQGLVNDYEENF